MSFPYAYNTPAPSQSQPPSGCYPVYPYQGYPQQNESFYPPSLFQQETVRRAPPIQRPANVGGHIYPSYHSPAQNGSSSGWTPPFPPQGAPGAHWTQGSNPFTPPPYYPIPQFPLFPAGYCPPPPPSVGGTGEDLEPPPPGVEMEPVQLRPDTAAAQVAKDTVEPENQVEAGATPPLPAQEESGMQHVLVPPPAEQPDETPPPSPEGTPPPPDAVDMAIDTPPLPASPVNSVCNMEEMQNQVQQETATPAQPQPQPPPPQPQPPQPQPPPAQPPPAQPPPAQPPPAQRSDDLPNSMK